jgi:hypothetical protein
MHGQVERNMCLQCHSTYFHFLLPLLLLLLPLLLLLLLLPCRTAPRRFGPPPSAATSEQWSCSTDTKPGAPKPSV